MLNLCLFIIYFAFVFGWTLSGLTNGFFNPGSQCWYFSHEPSSLFHHSVLVDLSVSMIMHWRSLRTIMRAEH